MDKDTFLKTKKKVLKKYPNAKTMMDNSGKYYVATKDGRDICNILISQTMNGYKFDQTEGAHFGLDNFVIDAWQQAEVAIKSYHVVNRNNGKFSDEKIMKKILKDE